MKQKHKFFHPFDQVLARDGEDKWQIDFYSHWNEEQNLHVTLAYGYGLRIEDKDILPYEGNEHLLATSDDPEEEIELKEGEWLMICDKIEEKPDEWMLRYFLWVSEDKICTQSVRFAYPDPCAYNYAIRFSDFNPDDLEETMKHILCVRDGKIVRYKG